jgi:mycofactocin system glycosyltransferase
MADARAAFPPDGAVIRLNAHTRVDDGGRVLVGGSPTRVARISAAGASRLRGRDLVVRDATGQALARHLLGTGMGDLVAASLPAVPLEQLTVVVPVRDRAPQLARMLASIPSGVAGVLVVDDASERPGPVARVAAAAGAHLVALAENGGPAVARNAGLREVATPYVAFVDSDVVLEPGALDTLLRHLADPDVALVAPRVLGTDGANWITRYEDARSSLDLGRDAATVRPRSRVSWVSSTCLVARVDALGAGFDAGMRVGEDVDLVWRLVAAGHRVTYDPAATVRHEHRATLRTWARRKFDYGTGAHGLAVRHPEAIAPVVLPPWAVGFLVAVAAQRRWSAPVAAGLLVVVATRIASRIPHVPRPRRLAARLTVDGAASTLAQGSALLVRHWWPLTLVAALGSRRVRRAALVAAIADAALEYARVRPRLDPVRFALARRLDDLAYGAGVWWSSLRGRSIAALRPAIVRTDAETGASNSIPSAGNREDAAAARR